MAIDNLPASNETRLSGVYIRSLVKQLTTSKPVNTKENLSDDSSTILGGYNSPSITPPTKGEKLAMAKPNNNQNGQGHKKQVRRRLHTSRPYQERLLNMAEARKEIVTALKFHRATMKQQQQQQQQQDSVDYQSKNKSISRMLTTTNNAVVENYPYYPSYSYNSYPCLSSYSSPFIHAPPIYETLIDHIPLPNQTLGLNLNLTAFTNLESKTFCNNTISSSTTSSIIMSPSPSSSSSPPSTPSGPTLASTTIAIGPTSGNNNNINNTNINNNGMDMHPALDEEEMAEIKSIGEQHQIEWDDTLNLVKSAWWFKFLKTEEFGKEIKGEGDHYDYPFGDHQFMEFPAWLSANESFLQQHLDDSCSEDYWQDTCNLNRMDIGDIDGMDDEWLS